MIENTIAYKRTLKKENLLKQLEDAKKSNKDGLVRQLESKIALLERKWHPTVFWDSYNKGAYRKKG